MLEATEVSSQPASREGETTDPLEFTFDLGLSVSAQSALGAAAEEARKHGKTAPGSHALVAGILRYGPTTFGGHSFRLFCDYALTHNPERERVLAWLSLPSPPSGERAPTLPERLSSPSIPLASPRLGKWLSHSVTIARRAGSGELRAHHLLGGLIAEWDRVGARFQAVHGLIERGFRIDEFRRALLDNVKTFVRNESQTVWNEILGERQVIAGYHADDANPASAADDLLEVSNDANALAMLVAAREITPPLSIGLFGDWGTGKSFFMGLMRRRIEALCAPTAEKTSQFCTGVRQINFNAWHYSDASLWPSLVTTIFDDLACALRPKDAHERLSSRLADSSAHLENIEKRLASARAALAETQTSVMQTRETPPLKDTGAAVITSAAALAALDDARVRDLARVLGIEYGAEPKPEQFDRLVREAGGLWEAAWGTARQFFEAGGSQRAKNYAWLAVATAVTGVGCWVVHEHGLPNWLTYLGTLVTLPSPIWSRVATAWRGLGVANRISKDAVEEQRRRHLERLKALSETTADLERQRVEARQAADEAQKWLNELKPNQAIAEFVEKRSRSEDYRKQYGIIANIRHDFERLRTLLEESTADTTRLSVDRIVLYIDDLDRCPAERVVQVLEAVHLLLASRLFVVIVAVDPRWLRAALRARYPELLADGGDSPSDAPAAPQDYLEKIFQIPISLRPLGDAAHTRMLESLFVVADDRAPGTVDGHAGAPAIVRREALNRTPGATSTAADGSTTSSEPSHVPPPRALDILRVSDKELAFMRRLGGIMRTPRAIKRFASTYRLIRATRLSLAERQSDDDFEAIMILLALQTGRPRHAQMIFSALRRTRAPLDVVMKGLRPRAVAADPRKLENDLCDAIGAHDRHDWEVVHDWLSRSLERASLLSVSADRLHDAIRAVERFSFVANGQA